MCKFRVYLNAKPDLLSHFAVLAINKDLPTLDILLLQAAILVDRYASQDAYEQALSKAESTDAPAPMKVEFDSSWTRSALGVLSLQETNMAPDTQDTQANVPHPNENLPKAHQESKNFDGDRVLANSILFLQDFGWWMELAYAIPEGDIGRAFEVLKVNNFCLNLLSPACVLI